MINQFKAKFEDIARLNRFRVECSKFPSGFILLNATIPGESWNTETQRDPDNTGSIPYGFPVDIIQNDAAITFVNDSLYTQRTLLDAWWAEIFDSEPNMGFGYWQDYKADVKIIAMDRQGRDAYTVILEDAYPVMYSDITFDSSVDSGLSTTTVTFKYGDIIKKASGSASGAVRGPEDGINVFGEILRGVLGSI